MNIIISETMCGNKNCIGVEPYCTKPPKPNIIIEDCWDLSHKIIEDAMVGLISHETLEWLLSNMLFGEDYCSIHDLTGTVEKIEQYVGNTDGLVITVIPWKPRKSVMVETVESVFKKPQTVLTQVKGEHE